MIGETALERPAMRPAVYTPSSIVNVRAANKQVFWLRDPRARRLPGLKPQ